MRTVDVQVYKFSELSDSAKVTARDKYREHDEFEPEYEPYETAAAILGIDLTEERSGKRSGTWYPATTIQYSGFWSQGDGASFTGTYKFLPGCCEKIRDEFGKDETLWGIADRLSALHCRLRLASGGWLEGKITQDSNMYVHSHTMDATAYDKDGEEMDIAVSDEFRDLMREFADWIYGCLEDDYNYQTSDENVDYILEANDYEFDEDGERAA